MRSVLWNLVEGLETVAPQFEIVEIHPERAEILLKAHVSGFVRSKLLRSILQELQRQSQRSFVALVNPVTQYVLITVRG